jgi:hypothetical protein
MRSRPPAFKDAGNMISLESKYTKEELSLYLKDNVFT